MTEIPEYPNLIDPIAFTAALLLAPILVALAGFWILLIPVVGAVFGAPFYLSAGSLAFAVGIMQGVDRAVGFAAIGFLAVLASVPLAAAFGLDDLLFRGLEFESFLALGLVHGTLWGFVFGVLYRWFRNPFFVSKP